MKYGFGHNRTGPWAPAYERRQVHGVRCVEITRAGQDAGEADGFWTRVPGLQMNVLTADCVPILLHRVDQSAVAALHAGWRGTFARIAEHFFRTLPAELARPEDWNAILGPSIRHECYEVSAELVLQFQTEFPGLAAHEIEPSPRHLDLIAVNRHQLHSMGISKVEIHPDCTYCASDPEGTPRYCSYRRGIVTRGNILGSSSNQKNDTVPRGQFLVHSPDMDQFKSREEVTEKDRWNLELIYPNLDLWEEDFKKIEGLVQKVEKYQGKIGASAQTLKQAFDEQMELNLVSEKLYVYAHLISDQDTREATNLGRVDRIRSKLVDAAARLSWIDPELLALPIETLKSYEKDPLLKAHSRRIEFMIRSKPHQRSAEVEELLTLASEPTGGGYKTFSLLENADMKMPIVKDGKGDDLEVNHGNYISFLESPDRILRKNAFEGYLNAFGQFKNTLASTLDNHVRKQIFYSRARNFKTAIESSLFSDAIPLQVYNGLIETVHKHLPLLHRWIELRKKLLGLSDLALYDIFVPMVRPANVEYTYEQAAEMVLKGVAPLGEVYVNALRKSFDERWIDVYYTPGKRSGAYSSGMFLTKPYILLNHKENLGSAFTLAHELGHSLHSFFSNQTQPYPKADYPIFLAEVASTTNEMLLHHYLYERADTKEMKLYLLDHMFNQFRGTLYRQVQFAEFERDIHAMAEAGEPLTAESLGAHYSKLNAHYYGSGIHQHELIRHEWSRIPHFYYNFYVYKYSTSFAAAQYFARKIYDGDTVTREKYLDFLKSGSSQDPLDTLVKAGVDLRDSKPIEAAFKVFEEALDEFERIHS